MGASESTPSEPLQSAKQTNYPKECPMHDVKNMSYPQECPMHQENQSVPREGPLNKNCDTINPANMVDCVMES